MTKLLDETIGGDSISITVDNTGVFRATYDEEEYSAKTLEELRALLKRAEAKRAGRQAIEVTVIDLVPADKAQSRNYAPDPFEEGRGVVHALLRKRHERQSAYLLTSVGGVKFQIRSYGTGSKGICRRLTDAEVAEYLRLGAAVDEAKAAFEAFREQALIDPDEVLGRKETR
jgi:hypothetical protein